MDPITAFSLACGVFEIVNFSGEVVKKCRELYRDGSLSENEDVERMATHLTRLRTELSLPSERGRDELWDLGAKCSETARDLITELQELKATGPHRRRKAFGKTIRTMWKKNAIDDIQRRLDQYRNLLDSRILTDLRYVEFT